ncbi:acyltransferase family protein [Legionella shakespearei]|uniref:O-antigen acetylase n=1 Tax=Legionella shakespearei DSM 23087 TaxID=1122169 RepID=A0A0W0YVI7_9GAMM|nr:acyltransferase family protein [Legionella shakespearei]KTD60719.1 O-antigen acetylase [Legionella shakespearei DSM 23087]
MTNLKYLNHIDGLRAIAVLLVLFNHVGFGFFPGGYVGVDVFFVISGFLITRIILTEFNTTGNFSYSNFYFRRVKRILPALFFVLICTLLAAFCFFPPALFQDVAGSSFAATLSFSNIYFWFNSGYFDLSSLVKPLLHTWSLGVEEQFYLFWPVLLIFCLKRRISFQKLVLSLSALSLIANIVLQKHNISLLFYGMPFRAFEFGFGVILSHVTFKKILQPVFFDLMFISGFGLIFIPAFFYTSTTLFPSYNAVAPALGAAFLIYAGNFSRMSIILANPYSRFIGLISYSLYLVHWPLIVFWNYLAGTPLSTAKAYLLISISFVLATMVYYFVEQPFRKINHENKRKIIYLAGSTISAAVISVLSLNIYFQDGWLWRLPEENRMIASSAGNPKEYHIKFFGGSGYPYPFGYTYQNSDEQPAKIILMGDSHAQMLQHGLHELIAKSLNFSIYMAGSSCLILPGVTRLTNEMDWDTVCPDVLKHALVELKKNEDSVLVLSESWVSQLTIAGLLPDKKKLTYNLSSTRPEDYPDLINKLDELRSLIGQHKLILFGDVPTSGGQDIFSCLTQPFHESASCKQDVSAQANQNAIHLNQVLKDYANNHKNTYYLDPYEAFCDEKNCRNLTDNREPIYSDGSHLSKVGSLLLIEHFRKKLSQLITPLTNQG